MSIFTKKYMVDDYERLRNHSDLLELYLYDTQMGRKPDAVEAYKEKKQGKMVEFVEIQLWRALSGCGGYVVINQSIPNIFSLDEAIKLFSDRLTENTLGIRICLERLRVKRNQMARNEVAPKI